MRIYSKKLQCLCFLFVFTIVSYAETLPLQFRHYNIGDGLSQNAVKNISQDSEGFLWFGTEDGLNRFDGYSFNIYRSIAFDTTSLSDWDVSAILHDHAGREWIGTLRGGLNLLDPETGWFYHLRHDKGNSQTLSHDSVTTLYEDAFHRLWIGTVNGLNRLILPDGADERPISEWIHQVRFIHYASTSESTSLSYPFVTCIMVDSEGWLWVGTDHGLNVTHPDSMAFIRFFSSDNNKKCLASNYIRCLYEDASGQIWVGSEYGGLNRLIVPDLKDSSNRWQKLHKAAFQWFLPEKNNPNSIGSDVVYSIFEDPPGFLWIGTEQGLNRFDIESEQFERWEFDPDSPTSLSNNTIWTIFKDRSGLFWLGTDAGLNTFHEKQHQFEKYQHYPGHPETLSHPYVWCFDEDLFHNIWTGTTRGLNRFDPVTKHIRTFFYDPIQSNSLRDNNILSLCVDRDNILWVGFNGMGLDRAMIRKDQPPEFIHMDCTEKGLGSDYILTLYEDRDGALWIGTWDNGLRKILPEDRHHLTQSSDTNVSYIRFQSNPEDPNSISPHRIYAILQDHTGALWIGTDGDGLNVLSADHVQMKDTSQESIPFAHFRHNPEDPNSLSHNIVMCICEDHFDDLWFGTFGGGLNHYIRRENRFSHYTVADGLPNNIVYGILEDDEGFLWLSTNKGLSKFDPSSGNFHNFTIHDGLQDYEFNSGAYLKTQDGHLLFGGIHGFNVFDPQKISLNPYVPPVVITSLQVDNKFITIPANRQMRFSYKKNLLSIEYAALSYIYPEKNRYRYRMLPLNDSWIDAGTERKTIYTHLAPGKYTFQVQGSNNDGVWNEEGAILQFQIFPPFWQTAWFRLFMTIAFLACFYLIYHIRTRSVQRLNQQLEQRVQERTEALEEANEELQTALENVTALEGLLPICAACKKIRDEQGDWHQVDVYIRAHSDVKFSHGLCPDCCEEYEKEI